jgi:hypothetical protein
MTASLPDSFIAKANSLAKGAIVFAVMRNERIRVASWLAHYRRMGVSAFAIIDNGSSDGTFEYLSGEKDVALIRIKHSFAAANFGIDWLNEFHARLDPGHWVLFADADELLVYRGWPAKTLAQFTAEVLGDGSNAVFGFLLDMYPDGPVDAASANGHDLFESAPCFDSDYCFRSRPKKPWEDQPKTIEIVGGPRIRLLSSFDRERETNWVDYFVRGQIDRILPIVPDRLVGTVVRLAPRQMPSLSKVPLVLSGSGFRYVNNHGGGPGRFHAENVVCCHFKFLQDFAIRVSQEAARKEHYRRGAEYIMYVNALNRFGRLDLRYAGTRRFLRSQTLADLGLIRDITCWLDTRQSSPRSRPF